MHEEGEGRADDAPPRKEVAVGTDDLLSHELRLVSSEPPTASHISSQVPPAPAKAPATEKPKASVPPPAKETARYEPSGQGVVMARASVGSQSAMAMAKALAERGASRPPHCPRPEREVPAGGQQPITDPWAAWGAKAAALASPPCQVSGGNLPVAGTAPRVPPKKEPPPLPRNATAYDVQEVRHLLVPPGAADSLGMSVRLSLIHI